MATQTYTALIDDLDGESEAAETVRFGLDGTDYEIDLTEEHASELRDALATWVGSARRAGRAGGRSASRSGNRSAAKSASTDDGPTADEIRAWAKENGHQVSERGRISGKVQEAYAAAH